MKLINVYFVTKEMKTFSIQLVFTYIILSNAKSYATSDCSDLPQSMNGPNLVMAALVLFMQTMEVRHLPTVMVLDTTEILTLGGSNVAFGMVLIASQRIFLIVLSCQIP